MVRTLANSFAANRIHQAYIFTGVRGTGKTTTARILARASTTACPARSTRPSVDMPELGVHCQAIMDSRHVDVIEMDAASHTGVDDVREIIENARYRPVSARTKVYIIDEVHMLSKQAFNAPPEDAGGAARARQVPVRHDRDREGADHGALALHPLRPEADRVGPDDRASREDLRPPRASRSSRRRSPSSPASPRARCATRCRCSIRRSPTAGPRGVTALAVRDMLGLSDRGEIVTLFERAMKGEIAEALELMRALYRAGADPADILIEVAEFCHFVTAGQDRARRARRRDDRREPSARRAANSPRKLTMGALTRAWQILLKGVEDVKDSPRPLASAEMALIRLAYASDLPTPEEALRKLAETTGLCAASRAAASPAGGGPRAKRERRDRAGGARPRARARLAPAAPPAPRRSGSRGSRTSSRWRGPSATSSSSRRSSGTCGSTGSSRAASPFRWSRALRPASRRRWPNACRNGPASAGWWRSRRARPRRPCARRRPPAKPSGRPAPRPIRWCARCSSASRARASSRCARPEAAAAPAPPRRKPDDDVGYADSDPPSTTIFERGEAAMDIMGMMKKAQASAGQAAGGAGGARPRRGRRRVGRRHGPRHDDRQGRAQGRRASIRR